MIKPKQMQNKSEITHYVGKDIILIPWHSFCDKSDSSKQ